MRLVCSGWPAGFESTCVWSSKVFTIVYDSFVFSKVKQKRDDYVKRLNGIYAANLDKVSKEWHQSIFGKHFKRKNDNQNQTEKISPILSFLLQCMAIFECNIGPYDAL